MSQAASILLVEDDPGTVALARRRLERAGYEVTSAVSPAAALERLRQRRFDLILLDNRLPGESGLDFYLELKQAGIEMPAILMTGFTNEQTVIAALRVGMRDFIPKGPEFIDYLPQAVERVLLQVETERKLALEQAARAQAEAASRAKDVFLATLSHELRTPLHTILTWVRLLRTGRLDGAQVEQALETIERNVDHQASLVEDLLDVSRVVSGKLQLERSDVDIAALVREIAQAARHDADANAVLLSIEAPEAPVVVNGDPKRLKQVMSNLLGNALKFTPGGGSVTLRVTQREGKARVAVEDTGKGIAPELLPRIFEPFSQGEAAERPGLGLGLSISKHLVEAHGGSISALSPGAMRGTTVSVEIPCAQAPRAAEGRTIVPINIRRKDGPSLEGLRILVVDDDADSREVVQFALASRLAQVRGAGSVHEALEILSRSPADVVLTDIAMPGGDGYQLLRALREGGRSEISELPVVAFTAHASSQDRQRALAAGFHAYVAKPVDPFELLELLSRVHRARAAGETRR